MEAIKQKLKEDRLLDKKFIPTSYVNLELSYVYTLNNYQIAIINILTSERIFFNNITAEEILSLKNLQKITYLQEAGGYICFELTHTFNK